MVEILAVVAFAVFVLLLFVDKSDTPSAAAPTASNGAAANGAAIFSQQCARCHGDKGQGGIGPKLAGGAVTRDFPTTDAELVIVKGGEGVMPAFGKQLSRDELKAVVDFTRTQLQQR